MTLELVFKPGTDIRCPPRAPWDASCAELAFALRKFILRGAAARLGFDPVHGTVRKTVCAKERPWQR